MNNLQLEESNKIQIEKKIEEIEVEKMEGNSTQTKNDIINKNILGEFNQDHVIELIRKPPHLRSKVKTCIIN